MWKKLQKWWYFSVRNTVVRKGEHGGFRWCFRRFTLEISTLSGNWSAKWTAAQFPYGYLLAGKGDENIIGFAQTMYEVGMLLTTEQKFVDDVQKALKKYSQRVEKTVDIKDDEAEEQIALEQEKQVQERVEMPRRARRRADRETDRRFKKAMKNEEAQG